jgi:large subunit ribosomal protein LX
MDVKVYRVIGTALFNANKFPTRQKFVKYVTAVRPEDAVELIYSWFGSKNGIKRYNIKIEKVEEVKPEEVNDKTVRDLIKLDKIIL